MWSFLKFSLGCFLFGFCLSFWGSFGFFCQLKTISEKHSFLCLPNRSDRHRNCPVCRRQVTGAGDSWVVSEAPTEDDIATYILNMVDEAGQPHRPWPCPQADRGRTTWSFCFPRRLVLPLLAVLPQSALPFSSRLLWVCAALLKHRGSEQVSVCAVLITELFFQQTLASLTRFTLTTTFDIN